MLLRYVQALRRPGEARSVFIPFWDFSGYSMGIWSNLILFAVFSQYSMEMKAKSHTIYEFFPI